MLETLLLAYQDQFGEAFPLAKCADMREIDLINLIYFCVQENIPYREGLEPSNRVFGAPGQR